MSDIERLTHTTWKCKYHIVWIPKYRKKKNCMKNPKGIGKRNQASGRMPGKRNTGRTSDERPHTYTDSNTAEILRR